LRSAQELADAKRFSRKTIKHWGVLCRGVPQMARRATISYQHAIDAGIEAIKRHQMPLLASESSSTALLFIKATTFTNKAG
jgi:hypothetical protein